MTFGDLEDKRRLISALATSQESFDSDFNALQITYNEEFFGRLGQR